MYKVLIENTNGSTLRRLSETTCLQQTPEARVIVHRTNEADSVCSEERQQRTTCHPDVDVHGTICGNVSNGGEH